MSSSDTRFAVEELGDCGDGTVNIKQGRGEGDTRPDGIITEAGEQASSSAQTTYRFVSSATSARETPSTAQLRLQYGMADEPMLDSHPAGDLLEIDSLDSDSAVFDVDTMTDSESVRSSVYAFVEENGRRYHKYKAGSYFLPNDESEQDRLDLQHQLFLLTFDNQLSLVPTSSQLHNVLDIGTGTGIWAIDFAVRNPSAHVLGTDLSPIQPDFIPPNCSFEIDDVEDPWIFPQKFDLIHGRTLASCFKDPQAVINSAADALVPGGWLEFQDIVIPLRCIDDSWAGSALERWTVLIAGCTRRLGRDPFYSQKYRSMFAAAGLVDIEESNFVWPSNQWVKGKHNKRLAQWFQKDFGDGLDGFSLRLLTSAGGMSREEVLELVDQARKDLANPKIHCYLPVTVTMGRKA